MIVETKFGTFELVNEDKVERVVVGTTNSEGAFVNGLGEDADPLDILTEYDRQGGLIRGREGQKVKTGSFFDFKRKAARKAPEIVYVFRVNGQSVELPEDQEPTLEQKAATTKKRATKKK